MRLLFILLLTYSLLHAAEPAIGSPAPDIGAKTSFNTPDKGPVSLASFRGSVVLIDFWATWCGPCVGAIPHVLELHEKYKDKGLVVIGHTDATSENLSAFIAEKKMTYIVSVGTEVFSKAYGVTGIPQVFLIDVDGNIAWSGHPSSLQEKTVEELLKKAHPPGPLHPYFAQASGNSKVAKAEAQINMGKVGAGVKQLDKLATDKDADTAAAALVSATVVEAWHTANEAQLDQLVTQGDVFAAHALATNLILSWAGHDKAKAYQERAATLKKDPGYEAGKEYKTLESIPPEARKDPRFTKMVDAFLKKHPDGFYATKAMALKGG